ncbi:hypothetical protein N474_07455 [Pseudoalteromonas luteoviolacea CPMOR-2]|uniref:Uncharacterized protein n=1 Tax=Pseudoalteromonas luteoviolacea DSM 6061 TaxID=1365250 RepID=A0A161ZYS7_9GAMM|nr:hypothetical protein [Pseudoalteromonas luteoviolacea]KZN39539.1 hypothetical protein N475_14065 [Pseudoalteromonas luteoviolacea DSM 6061]KZN57808.1 hypothetical protein N474_07455 [Pseudoalteromonas luteoviolacea CPMOR-2]MBE0388409.1 hypothetical protein [Pseudoalteromonas luteoviolacea DSM 6061]
MLIQSIKNSFLIVSITVLSLLFTSSKELYEKLFVDWFGACRIVIDADFGKVDQNGKYPNALVSILAYGDVPDTITVKFIGSEKLASVKMIHSSSDNLIMHNDVSLTCPVEGELTYCQTKTQVPYYYEEIEWEISNFNKFVTPIFKVNFHTPLDSNAKFPIQTFIKNFEKGKACKVEPAKIYNFWTWGETWLIPIILFVVMVLFMSLSKYLESKKNNDQGAGP